MEKILYEAEDFKITIDEVEVVTYTNKHTKAVIVIETVQDTHVKVNKLDIVAVEGKKLFHNGT